MFKNNCFQPEHHIKNHLEQLVGKLDWESHNYYNFQINTIFQLIIGFSMEQVLAYSNFQIKTWTSLNVDLISVLNDTKTIKELKKEKIIPLFSKPDPIEVKKEAEAMKSTDYLSSETLNETQSLINLLRHLICEHGKHGCIRVRVKSLKVSIKRMRKRKHLIFFLYYSFNT